MSQATRTFIEPADVETQVFDWGRLSWLSEPRVTGTDRFSAGLVVLNPGMGHVRHNHPGVEEILYVVEGKGIQMVEVDGKPVEQEVAQGVLVHIPPDIYHSTVNTGDGPMKLIAIYSPPGPEALLREMGGVVIEPPMR
ncbi:MAG: cupin domain-containing protein [Candidatus Hydrogenedentes bacterium]|nr:cupin domain-containing protein [Candidatus Hydrogenedentota bacterium]